MRLDKLADAIRGLGATTKSAEYPSFAHEKVLRELERPDVTSVQSPPKRPHVLRCGARALTESSQRGQHVIWSFAACELAESSKLAVLPQRLVWQRHVLVQERECFLGREHRREVPGARTPPAVRGIATTTFSVELSQLITESPNPRLETVFNGVLHRTEHSESVRFGVGDNGELYETLEHAATRARRELGAQVLLHLAQHPARALHLEARAAPARRCARETATALSEHHKDYEPLEFGLGHRVRPREQLRAD